MGTRNTPTALESAGFQRIITNSTVSTLNSTVAGGKVFVISVETQSARIRFDGSNPTANTGVLLLAANSPYRFEEAKGSNIKIIGAAAGSVLNVQSWKYSGE